MRSRVNVERWCGVGSFGRRGAIVVVGVGARNQLAILFCLFFGNLAVGGDTRHSVVLLILHVAVFVRVSPFWPTRVCAGRRDVLYASRSCRLPLVLHTSRFFQLHHTGRIFLHPAAVDWTLLNVRLRAELL